MDFGAPANPPPPSFALNPQVSMDANQFQQRWGTLAVSSEVNIQLSVVPMQADIEGALAHKSIMTMASGDVGAQFKFFFYGQDQASCFYFVESVFDKQTMLLTSSIKCDNPATVSMFAQEMENALQPFKGGFA